jgi:hypothetical protein
MRRRECHAGCRGLSQPAWAGDGPTLVKLRRRVGMARVVNSRPCRASTGASIYRQQSRPASISAQSNFRFRCYSTPLTRPRMNRNGSGAAPRARRSSAARTTAGVSNVTRRPLFGSVHRIVPKSTATLRRSGRAARTASAMARSPSIRPAVAVVIASRSTVTVVCLGGRRGRAGRDGVAGSNSVGFFYAKVRKATWAG